MSPSDGLDEGQPVKDEAEQRVRTPLFPTYREVRHLLKVWPGRPRKQVTGLQAALSELRGTPQNTVDWTDPDEWIPERLSGAPCAPCRAPKPQRCCRSPRQRT